MMNSNGNGFFTSLLLSILTIALLILGGLGAQSAYAAPPDYIFFSINGDTTLSTMTQGDEFGWGSNCNLGATINWEIWFDGNSNSVIDPAVDYLLATENLTDGNLIYEENPVPDSWVFTGGFYFAGEPGNYIFKATDVVTDVTVQRIVVMVAMSSPPNQFTGQITIPGFTPPNSMLANRLVMAESETGDEGVFLAFTDNTGSYSMNVGAVGTGVDFYLMAGNVSGFVEPEGLVVTASGVVPNNDFLYTAAVDSVWGFVKDELGAVMGFESDVSVDSESSEKETSTRGGRYVVYFSEADKGDWSVEISSRNSPTFVTSASFGFSHDTLGSFQHDLILTRSDAFIYARITENGGPPANNYRVDAYSEALGAWAESVSGTGGNNVVAIGVSSLDASGWDVSLNQYDEDWGIPAGLISNDGGFLSDVSPGDTVTFNLVNGHLVSGTITLDPGDDPVNWNDLYVFAGSWGARVGPGGVYSLYTDTGSFFIAVYSDADLGYATDPAYRNLVITGDTTVGLGFTLNRTHCRVNGSIMNVPLPLDSPFYNVVARTGTGGADGYLVYAPIDPATGNYNIYLCDGAWTIQAPNFNLNPAPDASMMTISEIPDTVRSLDFDYGSGSCCVGNRGNVDCEGVIDIGDVAVMITKLFITLDSYCCDAEADVDQSGLIDIGDLTLLINSLFITIEPLDACL